MSLAPHAVRLQILGDKPPFATKLRPSFISSLERSPGWSDARIHGMEDKNELPCPEGCSELGCP